MTRVRFRQWNQSLNDQLDGFEASAIPEKETSFVPGAKLCNLYSHKLRALDLGSERRLQEPPPVLVVCSRTNTPAYD